MTIRPSTRRWSPNLRASRLFDRRFTSSGLIDRRCPTRSLPTLLDFVAEPRTRLEIEAMLEARFGEAKPRLWWALRTFAPLWHAPTGRPWSFASRASFHAASTALPPERRDESVRWLVRRYLEGFGPASVPDIAQFALLQRPVVREAIGALAGELVQLEGPDGRALYDLPGGQARRRGQRPHRRACCRCGTASCSPTRIEAASSRRTTDSTSPGQNGDVLPTLLVDGYVAGVWRPVEGGIEATAFHRLTDEAWDGLAVEAGALVAFLADREPAVYRRYAPLVAKAPERRRPGAARLSETEVPGDSWPSDGRV